MIKFKYISSTPCNTTIVVDGSPVDFKMSKDGVYLLPENDDFVKGMEANGILIREEKKKK